MLRLIHLSLPAAGRTRLIVLASAVLGGVSSLHCAGGGSGGPGSGAGGTDGLPRDNSEIRLGDNTSGDDDEGIPLNPLCGVGWCVPDDRRACIEPDGMGGQGGASFGGAAGGLNFNPGDLGISGVACQVGPAIDCPDSNCEIQRNCAPSGTSPAGDPCVTAADCAPGLACVGEGLSGVCRPYCCQGTEASCDESSFCDERRLLETPEIYVPVCLPLDDCPLTEPFPCEGDCSCQGNRACMIVRPDGATACTTPGAKQAGDSCSDQVTADCAHGFVCGPNQICLQICSTVSDDSGCADGWTCLKQSALGGDLGICTKSTDQSRSNR